MHPETASPATWSHRRRPPLRRSRSPAAWRPRCRTRSISAISSRTACIGLIDAAHRFDEARGIKFETFAERRVRGAMIDALRKDAWPRGVRRQRRELEAAREALRRELGGEPSLADLAARVGSDEKRLGRTIVRINTIESTSPLGVGRQRRRDRRCRPRWCRRSPSRPTRRTSVPKCATACAPRSPRCRRASGRSSASTTTAKSTMKQIGAEIGVNESRVSQLHARAIRRLRDALGSTMAAGGAAAADGAAFDGDAASSRPEAAADRRRRRSASARDARVPRDGTRERRGLVAGCADYHETRRAPSRSRSPSRNGLASQRQPLSSRKRSASVPATSPVTNITRRASAGVAAAIAR